MDRTYTCSGIQSTQVSSYNLIIETNSPPQSQAGHSIEKRAPNLRPIKYSAPAMCTCARATVDRQVAVVALHGWDPTCSGDGVCQRSRLCRSSWLAPADTACAGLTHTMELVVRDAQDAMKMSVSVRACVCVCVRASERARERAPCSLH